MFFRNHVEVVSGQNDYFWAVFLKVLVFLKAFLYMVMVFSLYKEVCIRSRL